MAYSAEVLSRARARLAMAKEDRESENREHLQKAYAQVPRLQQIDLQLRRTMALAAQAVFAAGGDAAAAMEEVKHLASDSKADAKMELTHKLIGSDDVHKGVDLETPYTGKGVVLSGDADVIASTVVTKSFNTRSLKK